MHFANRPSHIQGEPKPVSRQTSEQRARSIATVVDHIQLGERQRPIQNGQDSVSVERVVIFSDVSAPNSQLTGSLRDRLPGIAVDAFGLHRLGATITRPGDVVVVEALAPTQDELRELKSKLERGEQGALYRGLLSGPDQRTPEEISRPPYRRHVPGRPERAVGVEPDSSYSPDPGEPFPRSQQGPHARFQFHAAYGQSRSGR